MILQGDALEELRKLPDKCCSVCVTSPPYYNARDYGAADQLGTESSPEEYTRKLVEAFREVARVLKDDGTLWLNIGDSYAYRGRRDQAQGSDRDPVAAGSGSQK